MSRGTGRIRAVAGVVVPPKTRDRVVFQGHVDGDRTGVAARQATPGTGSTGGARLRPCLPRGYMPTRLLPSETLAPHISRSRVRDRTRRPRSRFFVHRRFGARELSRADRRPATRPQSRWRRRDPSLVEVSCFWI